ncbi:MAG: PIN domain-containing protein [Chitinophagaceae bacterium]|nr:PIN domain-containing protein [Chitinophagaceae bacterium]MCW5904107.1 PIN domain-containing protein [Chitinophagaceae bacterium]
MSNECRNVFLNQYLIRPVFSEHKDPFDRLIIATAITEKIPIISSDKKFDLYKDLVEAIW